MFCCFSQVKEYRQKAGTIKRNQQIEKKKNAELLEEARKRDGDNNGETEQMKVWPHHYGNRCHGNGTDSYHGNRADRYYGNENETSENR